MLKNILMGTSGISFSVYTCSSGNIYMYKRTVVAAFNLSLCSSTGVNYPTRFIVKKGSYSISFKILYDNFGPNFKVFRYFRNERYKVENRVLL